MRRILTPLILALLLFSAACGDDGDDDGDTAAAEASTDDAEGADEESSDDEGRSSGDADAEAFCEARTALDEAEDPTEGLDGSESAEEVEQAIRESFESLEDEISDLQDSAPDEISDDIDTLVEGIERFLNGDIDLDAFSTDEEILAATDRMDEFEAEHCGPDVDGEGQ